MYQSNSLEFAITDYDTGDRVAVFRAITSGYYTNVGYLSNTELRKATNTLIGVPVYVDHERDGSRQVGNVVMSFFRGGEIFAIVRFDDETAFQREIIRDVETNKISTVSWSIMFNKAEKFGDTHLTDIFAYELSLVRTGHARDPNATIQYKNFEEDKFIDKNKDPKTLANKQLILDHAFLHSLYKRIEDGEKITGWTTEDVLNFFKLVAKEMLKRGLKPRVLPGVSFKEVAAPFFDEDKLNFRKIETFFEKWNRAESMQRPIAYLVGGIVDKGSTDENIDIVIVSEERREDIEEYAMDALPFEYAQHCRFIYSDNGPESTAIPIIYETIEALPQSATEDWLTGMHFDVDTYTADEKEEDDDTEFVAPSESQSGYQSGKFLDEKKLLKSIDVLVTGVHDVKDAEAWSYEVLVGPISDEDKVHESQIEERDGANYLHVGRTHDTKFRAAPGEIIRVAMTRSIREKRGGKYTWSWSNPVVIGTRPEKEQPDSIAVLYNISTESVFESFADKKKSPKLTTMEDSPSWNITGSDEEWSSGEIAKLFKSVDKSRKIGDESARWVLQTHQRGETVHVDWRIEFDDDTLVGWTLFDPGSINDGLAISNTPGSQKIRCIAKAFQPKEWLSVEGVAKSPSPGSTKNYPGIFKIIDEGELIFLRQEEDFHEYLLNGKYLKGVVIVRRIEGREGKIWLFWKPLNQKLKIDVTEPLPNPEFKDSHSEESEDSSEESKPASTNMSFIEDGLSILTNNDDKSPESINICTGDYLKSENIAGDIMSEEQEKAKADENQTVEVEETASSQNEASVESTETSEKESEFQSETKDDEDKKDEEEDDEEEEEETAQMATKDESEKPKDDDPAMKEWMKSVDSKFSMLEGELTKVQSKLKSFLVEEILATESATGKVPEGRSEQLFSLSTEELEKLRTEKKAEPKGKNDAQFTEGESPEYEKTFLSHF